MVEKWTGRNDHMRSGYENGQKALAPISEEAIEG